MEPVFLKKRCRAQMKNGVNNTIISLDPEHSMKRKAVITIILLCALGLQVALPQGEDMISFEKIRRYSGYATSVKKVKVNPLCGGGSGLEKEIRQLHLAGGGAIVPEITPPAAWIDYTQSGAFTEVIRMTSVSPKDFVNAGYQHQCKVYKLFENIYGADFQILIPPHVSGVVTIFTINDGSVKVLLSNAWRHRYSGESTDTRIKATVSMGGNKNYIIMMDQHAFYTLYQVMGDELEQVNEDYYYDPSLPADRIDHCD